MSMLAALLIALVSVAGLNLPATALNNKDRSFPRDAADPRSIFVVTFSKSASVQASEWTRRLLEQQAKLAATIYQVAVPGRGSGVFCPLFRNLRAAPRGAWKACMITFG